MRISNHALCFLLAQYRAIFKRALVKGLTQSLLLTAAIAPFSTALAYSDLVDGTPVTTINGNGEGAAINSASAFSDVKVVVTDNKNNTTNRTSTALNVSLSGGSSTISGKFSVINTVPFDGRGSDFWQYLINNNALYVQGTSTLTFDENTESVFIAALGDKASFQDSAAISAKNTDHSQKGSNTVTVQGQKVRIIGDLDVSNANTGGSGALPPGSKNTINLILSSEESFWYGDQSGVYVSSDNTVNLTLKNGGEWIYRSSGSIDNLTLEEGGVVNLDDEEVAQKFTTTITDEHTGATINLQDYYGYTDFEKTNVKISNLSGKSGIFKMDLAYAETGTSSDYFKSSANSDYITVSESSTSGTHTVVFDAEETGIYDLAIGSKIYFARVKDGDTTDGSASFRTNHDGVAYRADEALDFVYTTQSEATADYTYWYFTRQNNVTGAYQDVMKAASYAAYTLATEMDSFHDRRAESHYVSGTDNGVWVRYTYSNLDLDNTFDMDKHFVQIGVDRMVGELYGKHKVGVSFDYSNADLDIPDVSGDNELERYTMNIYYSWLSDFGLYTDFVLKGGAIEGDYDVNNAAGADIGSKIDHAYLGFSLEGGWQLNLAPQFFVEPQLQVQYIHLEGDDFTTAGGVEANLDQLNSVIGRAGLRTGYSFNWSPDLPESYIYLKADVLHEFSADRGYYLVGRTNHYTEDFSGSETWYDVGIGADLAVTANTKLWLDAEHIFGGDYESSWQVSAGARYLF